MRGKVITDERETRVAPHLECSMWLGELWGVASASVDKSLVPNTYIPYRYAKRRTL